MQTVPLIIEPDPDDGTRQETPMYWMASPEIGGRRFARRRVAAVDLAGLNAGLELPMDLIAGYPTLRQADWLLDFPARRWALSEPG